MTPLSIIPLPYRLLALAATAVALFGYGWLKGAEHGEARLAQAEARALNEGVRIVVLRGAVTTRVETKYVPRLVRAQVITETITKEVPVYVPLSDPDLSPGFRVLHDAAAAGSVPDPARVADAAPVPAQDAARTIAENYGSCRQTVIQLEGLQEWIREQAKVK